MWSVGHVEKLYVVFRRACNPLERLYGVVYLDVCWKPLAEAWPGWWGYGRSSALYALMMFKILLLKALYGFLDDQAGYVIHGRLSFMRFIFVAPSDSVSDWKTIWLFREYLSYRRERLIICSRPLTSVLTGITIIW